MEEWRKRDLLPESELRCSLPQLLGLVLVIGLDKLVVDHEERVSWDIIRKRRDDRQPWHRCRMEVDLARS